MGLQARRPPGHAKRKALIYAADIVRLRDEGHSLDAIREALEDVGIRVSISTVSREVQKGRSASAVPRPSRGSHQTYVAAANRGVLGNPSLTEPAPGAASLPGKAIAEEFMRGRTTNPLFLKEPPK